MAELLPEWWDWELELSGHMRRRMADRRFNETDLRLILANAITITPNHQTGRTLIVGRLHAETWHVVLEPDPDTKKIAAITGYRVE